MTLPPSFGDATQYFEEAITFFRDYQILYNFANTHILLQGILEKMYSPDLQDIDVFHEEFKVEDLINKNMFITELLNRAQKLKVDYKPFDDRGLDKCQLNTPLSVKKKHELLYLAEEIKCCCENSNSDLVIDFGSGLGYLDEYVSETMDYRVLGIESNKNYYVAAKKRQAKYHKDALSNVKYVRHTVSATSGIAIEHFLSEKFPKYGNCCIVGLHSCADLTIDAINIFLNMANAKSLILMPCCYHKMKCKRDESGVIFENFPLSRTLNVIYQKYEGNSFLKTSFLRLASQPPTTNENLDLVVFNLISRAVLQVYCEKNNLHLERRKQKAVKTKLKGNFNVYLDNVPNGYYLKCKNTTCSNVVAGSNSVTSTKKRICECNLRFDLQEVQEIWQHHSNSLTLKMAAVFILIQRHLQPIFENFILFDRLTYMIESGLQNCTVKKILNETISPRCYAVLAYK